MRALQCCGGNVQKYIDSLLEENLVKILPEFRRNPTKFPVQTCPEFQVDSRWNPPESTGIIAGIPLDFHRNSGLFQPEFSRNSRLYSRWNSAGIPVSTPVGIPPGLLPAFRRNSSPYYTSAGFPLE